MITKKKYKALILDLDGTTIPNKRDGRPSQKVKATIAQAKGKIHIGIATGRPLMLITHLLDELSLSGPIITLDGTQIRDAISREILFEQAMSLEDIAFVIDLLKKRKVRFVIDDRNGTSEEYIKGYKTKDPIAIVALNMPEKQAEEIQKNMSHVSTIASHKIVAWKEGTFSLSITHTLATKQHAIFEVAKILGIENHEIIGVGDGYNDFPLLMGCGLKIAMGNAVSELKAIADYIAPSVEEDGVADVIKKFVL